MHTVQKLVAVIMLGVSSVAFAGPVNVNSADAKTLAKELVGVGDKLAEAIVAERAKGPFKDGPDLAKRVKGIGDALIAKNKDNLKF